MRARPLGSRQPITNGVSAAFADLGPLPPQHPFEPHADLLGDAQARAPRYRAPSPPRWCSAETANRDVTLLAVSRAPLEKLEAFKRRLGWTFEWVSSGESDFNYDFAVSFRDDERREGRVVYNYAPLATDYGPDMPGFSVFAKDEGGAVFHTYSTFGRGIEIANPTYQLLDLLPKGRDEGGRKMAWVRYHDEYPATA